MVLLAAVPPRRLKTDANPEGTPIEQFNGVRASVLADRSQFFKELAIQLYNYNLQGTKVSEGFRDAFWLQGMQSSIKATIDCLSSSPKLTSLRT